MGWSKRKFVGLWLSSAAVVVVVRIAYPSYLGPDLSLQLQAAQNLLHGHGLSIYSLGGPEDLAQPNDLTPLPFFPCGYSIYAAAVMGLGFGLSAVVKMAGTAATILGWWGWGKLAYAFVREGANHDRLRRYVGAAIAIVTPLLYTPPWWGTDIFLWMAVPWVLICIHRGGQENACHNPAWLDVAGGVLCGFSILFRYATLFLAIYAALLIFCQSKANLKLLVRRETLFALGALPFLALQMYVNYFRSASAAAPGSLRFTPISIAIKHTLEQLGLVTMANFAAFWWMPERIMHWLTQPANRAPWLLLITIALLLSPVFLAQISGWRRFTSACRDIRISALGLIAIVPVFLLACAPFGVSYVGIRRYYLPLLPLAVLAAYAFAFAQPLPRTRTSASLSLTSRVYLVGYLGTAAVWIVLLFMPGTRGTERRAEVIATHGPFTPSLTKVTYEFSPVRNYIVRFLRENADCILVTNVERLFCADPNIDWSRLHRLDGLNARYVTGPARVIIAAQSVSDTMVQTFLLFDVTGEGRQTHVFEGFPGLHVIAEFPDEHVKVLEARVPDGIRIPLNQQPADDI